MRVCTCFVKAKTKDRLILEEQAFLLRVIPGNFLDVYNVFDLIVLSLSLSEPLLLN